MQSYTTQSHQRNYQGNVVMPQKQKRPSKHQKVLTGIAATVMALAVVVTGGLLGATTIHNQQLKDEVQTLRIQAAEVSAETEQTQSENDESQKPMTLEIRPNETETSQQKTRRHHRRPVKPQIN